MKYEVRFEQKYIGQFDSRKRAETVIKEYSPHFVKIGELTSEGKDLVEFFACHPNGVANYAYASITSTGLIEARRLLSEAERELDTISGEVIKTIESRVAIRYGLPLKGVALDHLSKQDWADYNEAIAPLAQRVSELKNALKSE